MSPSRLRKYFATATPEELELLTEPCDGNAHREGVDHCVVCANCVWGRRLKRV